MNEYQKYRERKLKYQNEYYHKITGSNSYYPDHYIIHFPNGDKKYYYSSQNLAEKMGYSISWVNKCIRENRLLAGCKIERVYKGEKDE